MLDSAQRQDRVPVRKLRSHHIALNDQGRANLLVFMSETRIEAVMTNGVQIRRRDMPQEPANEFLHRDSLALVSNSAPAGLVIRAPAKGTKKCHSRAEPVLVQTGTGIHVSARQPGPSEVHRIYSYLVYLRFPVVALSGLPANKT